MVDVDDDKSVAAIGQRTAHAVAAPLAAVHDALAAI